jgi:hypothetical protein
MKSMTKTATIITTIVVMLILGGAFWLFMQPTPAPLNDYQDTVSGDAAGQVRSVVTNFGTKLKNVSLLSTSTVAGDIGTQYGLYLSSDLLARWEADPRMALGRVTSSPWPDRIDIASVTQTGTNEYTVEGVVVEVTSSDTTASSTPASYPITLKLTQTNGTWVITSIERRS